MAIIITIMVIIIIINQLINYFIITVIKPKNYKLFNK